MSGSKAAKAAKTATSKMAALVSATGRKKWVPSCAFSCASRYSASHSSPRAQPVRPAAVKVGAAAAELEADDMVIGGSILPHKVKGQEGQLRAVAIVIEKPGAGKACVATAAMLEELAKKE